MANEKTTLAHYKLKRTCTEEDILRVAEEILAKRFERGDALTDPAAAGRIMKMRLAGQQHEVFSVAFLDTRHRIIAIEDLFRGTVDGCEVHPREVVKAALRYNSAAVILAHNHPSGSTEPSQADRAVTARLKASLALVNIRLLDHFIVGDGAPLSMAARGWV
ncbi:DNA repair protein RadC [Luteimonas sp. RD2P54]|uniref:DNA repair protein RadC n=1 Tax=Luteimonas endophytica TaxID=3042023 RepID=A0ABT6JBR9_9GAMM|nr:DNA repair protein RadC [Luteimonas endophytica]MDH5824209.1 DNA repair protein RadC [Luteimonas endophytica]